MDIWTILLIALGLAMDAFAVSLGIGTNSQSTNHRARFRLAFHFGWFQAMMPVIGWLAGRTVATYISAFDHWVAFVLLAYIGINMIRSGLKLEVTSYASDPSRGKILVILAIATSIDALAVGLSMSMLKVDIILPSVIIGIVAALLSTIGLFIGNKLGEKFGKRMEIIGGVILIAIGIRVVLSHLLG
jgi:putative Mn2+ efflux pump MntP